VADRAFRFQCGACKHFDPDTHRPENGVCRLITAPSPPASIQFASAYAMTDQGVPATLYVASWFSCGGFCETDDELKRRADIMETEAFEHLKKGRAESAIQFQEVAEAMRRRLGA
jgi:hypothetical protein